MESKKPYYHAIAFISDIHSNLEALEAVLDDIEKNNVSAIYCLGDLVGYGPDPQQVIQKMAALKEKGKLVAIVPGNHDYGICHQDCTKMFISSAKISNEWTMQKLQGTPEMDFLQRISNEELTKEVGRFKLVHSTLNPEPGKWEYLRTKMASQNFVERKIVFVGHSHVPAIYSRYSAGKEWNPITLFENDGYYFLPKAKNEPMQEGRVLTEYRLNIPGSFPTMIINIGSVGQPRDDCPYARYALYITVDVNNYIEYRQVGYNYQKTIQKLKDRGLACDEELAIRLCLGGKTQFSKDMPKPDWFPF